MNKHIPKNIVKDSPEINKTASVQNKMVNVQKKPTYASVAASGTEMQGMDTKRQVDISQTLQLILDKMTSLEDYFSKINKRVNKLGAVLKRLHLIKKEDLDG